MYRVTLKQKSYSIRPYNLQSKIQAAALCHKNKAVVILTEQSG